MGLWYPNIENKIIIGWTLGLTNATILSGD